ncbi:A33 protein, partial [Crypturellus soui]|nr:A33 protein [Crypturellus soui]
AGMAGRSREQRLREELTCAICCDLFAEPVMLECMHHFCQGCIQRYWARSARATCPQCRREFPTRRFRRHYLLAGLVAAVQRGSAEECRRDAQVRGTGSAWHRASPRPPPPPAAGASWWEMLESLACALSVPALLQRLCSLFLLLPNYLCHGRFLCLPGLCSSSFALPSRFSCRSHSLLFASAQKVSGELHCKIQAEFMRLHQILKEEERAVLAALGKEEEQLQTRLHGDVRRLEEGISKLQRDIERMEQTLSNMEEVSLQEVSLRGCRERSLQADALGRSRGNPLSEGICTPGNTLLHFSAVPDALTFDPESAHPNLVFSRDLTAVTEREEARPVPYSPRRFQRCVNVLGSRAFDSGQHYWEVWVGSKTKWDLGVAAEAVDRAARVKLCPENGYWTLRLRNKTEYWATATPWVRLAPRRPLRKVGVLLDCHEGTVTFFDAGDMSHLFTFRQVSAERYCPFFSTCFSDGEANGEPMRICHLAL